MNGRTEPIKLGLTDYSFSADVNPIRYAFDGKQLVPLPNEKLARQTVSFSDGSKIEYFHYEGKIYEVPPTTGPIKAGFFLDFDGQLKAAPKPFEIITASNGKKVYTNHLGREMHSLPAETDGTLIIDYKRDFSYYDGVLAQGRIIPFDYNPVPVVFADGTVKIYPPRGFQGMGRILIPENGFMVHTPEQAGYVVNGKLAILSEIDVGRTVTDMQGKRFKVQALEGKPAFVPEDFDPKGLPALRKDLFNPTEGGLWKTATAPGRISSLNEGLIGQQVTTPDGSVALAETPCVIKAVDKVGKQVYLEAGDKHGWVDADKVKVFGIVRG